MLNNHSNRESCQESRKTAESSTAQEISACTKPELLAPAGTLETGIAAFDAGADAVYLGLGRFNARERSRNFSVDDLAVLLSYSRKNGRRVYVAMNTLVKEGEVPAALEMLCDLVRLRPDALIVQDIGLVRIIRRHYPELEIHASTQMGIHNSAGLEVAGRMGIKRVILERQVTRDEIVSMVRRSPVRLEVFVHGALCCSRAGSCLFSSWMGGWSGNRGKCKQPCRRRYFSESGNGFFFSPGDLYSLDDIPFLRKTGVAGLKIEGRLRAPDYVSRVVSAYRMALDCPDGEWKSMRGRARAVLAEAPGRKWVSPYRTRADFGRVVNMRSIGAAGRLCGNVVSVSGNRITLDLSRPLSVGDRIRVQSDSGEEGSSLSIRNIAVNGIDVAETGSVARCVVGVDGTVEHGGRVFRLGGKTVDMSKRIAGIVPLAATIDLDIRIAEDSISVSVSGGAAWEHDFPLKQARNKPLTPEAVGSEFRKTRNPMLGTGNVNVNLPERVFVPSAQVKNVRRLFWEWASENIDIDSVERNIRQRCDVVIADHAPDALRAKGREITTVIAGKRPGEVAPEAIVAVPVDRAVESTEEVILPDFCAESDLPDLRSRLNALLKGGTNRIRVTSLFGFAWGDELACATVTACFAIPVCNRFAAEELRELCAERFGAWPELDKNTVDLLADALGDKLEVLSYGRIPVLTTRMDLPIKGKITDGRGAGFEIEKQGCLSRVYPDGVFSKEPPDGVSRLIDLSHALPGETPTSTFNYEREFL